MSLAHRHLVVVEAYEGTLEHLTDDPAERRSASGLGLPLDELAEQLQCRITVLTWDGWLAIETDYGSPFTWVSTPATRPVTARAPVWRETADSPLFQSARVTRRALPARDPDHWLLFDGDRLSPRRAGFNDSEDIGFFLSYCLATELRALSRDDPFHAVIVPTWGGIGYVAQMERATGAAGHVDVPFVAVTTDSSATRQRANQEAMWSRPATVRRQLEDMSLALADLALVFGERGRSLADRGRLADATRPVMVPRRVDESVLSAIAAASRSGPAVAPRFFLDEPLQAASGALVTLEATAALRTAESSRAPSARSAVVATGCEMVFAPMRPRGFRDYWSSRGWVRELVDEGWWTWRDEPPADAEGRRHVRLYPSLFEHLPNVWSELARGSLVLLSPAAAEGLVPDAAMPPELVLESDPTAESLARALRHIASRDADHLGRLRRQLCEVVAAAHQGATRRQLLEECAGALDTLMRSPPSLQDLARVATLLLDRRLPLAEAARQQGPRQVEPLHLLASGVESGRLSVVVTCHDLGSFITQAVESVLASRRPPDDVLLVDDGSRDPETLECIARLERAAQELGAPLRVIRQRNQGLAAARNAGLAAARGEFISFLDGDDLIEPDFYDTALPLLEHYPQLGGVAAWAFIFGAEAPDGYWNAPQPELPLLLVENTVIVPCVMRTALLRRLGGYDVAQRYNYEDWELAIRLLLARWPVVTIPRYLERYRIRGDSLLRTMSPEQHQLMREAILRKHHDSVSRFAMEIALQVEHRLSALLPIGQAKTDESPVPPA
ncbi:MAG TPA: glycosyltransferase family A protein [Gemmatimonadaceae bacterium]|nr:glycosyltransferase family A protein [Gemmatimonadaceae bacterium]